MNQLAGIVSVFSVRKYLWLMTVVLPQPFNQALFGTIEERLHCVRDVQRLQLRHKDVALQVVTAWQHETQKH